MDQILDLFSLDQAGVAVVTVVGFASLVSLVFGGRVQVANLALSSPRLAALIQLLRGLGIDTRKVCLAVYVLFKGRLPEQRPKADPDKTPVALVLLFALATSNQACSSTPPPKDIVDGARAACEAYLGTDAGRSVIADYTERRGIKEADKAIGMLCDLLSDEFVDAALAVRARATE